MVSCFSRQRQMLKFGIPKVLSFFVCLFVFPCIVTKKRQNKREKKTQTKQKKTKSLITIHRDEPNDIIYVQLNLPENCTGINDIIANLQNKNNNRNQSNRKLPFFEFYSMLQLEVWFGFYLFIFFSNFSLFFFFRKFAIQNIFVSLFFSFFFHTKNKGASFFFRKNTFVMITIKTKQILF